MGCAVSLCDVSAQQHSLSGVDLHRRQHPSKHPVLQQIRVPSTPADPQRRSRCEHAEQKGEQNDHSTTCVSARHPVLTHLAWAGTHGWNLRHGCQANAQPLLLSLHPWAHRGSRRSGKRRGQGGCRLRP